MRAGYPTSRHAANLAGAAAPPNEEEIAEDESEFRENHDHQRHGISDNAASDNSVDSDDSNNLEENFASDGKGKFAVKLSKPESKSHARGIKSRGEKKKQSKPGTPVQRIKNGATNMAKNAGSAFAAIPQFVKNPFKNPLKKKSDEATKSKKKKKKKKKKSSMSAEPAEPSRVSVLLKNSSTGNTLDFREISDSDLGIDLEAREKYQHHQLNPHNPVYGTENQPSFDDPFLEKWYTAIKTFLETMLSKNFRDREGKPLLWNLPSVPVGKPKHEPVVVLLFHYITSEEAYPLLKAGKYRSYTATHSDHTIIPNTIEMPRRALGDAVFFSLCLGDVVPFAYWYESSPEEHCEEEVLEKIMLEWRKVLNVLLEAKDVKIAIGAGTAQDRFAEFLGKPFDDILRKYPNKFISAATVGEEHAAPPHPQALYDIRKLSNMDKKLTKARMFYSGVMRIFDQNAPDVEFFDNFEDEFSALFDLCRRAYLDGCSRGGTEKWKRTQAALDRRENKEPKQEGDDKLLEGWDNFQLGGTNNWELTKAALLRLKNDEPLLPGDEERIADWEAFQTGMKRYRDMIRIRTELVRQFLSAGSNGRQVVENHTGYDDFKSYFEGDAEVAFKEITEVVEGFNSRFDARLVELREYKEKYDDAVVPVGDHAVLVVDHNRAPTLWDWYNAAIGYNRTHRYRLNLYECPGSTQYQTLEQLGATFDKEVYSEAENVYKQRKEERRTNKAGSRHELMGGLMM